MRLYGIEYQPFYDGIESMTPYTELVRCTHCLGFGIVDLGEHQCPDCESRGTLIDIEPHEVKQDDW